MNKKLVITVISLFGVSVLIVLIALNRPNVDSFAMVLLFIAIIPYTIAWRIIDNMPTKKKSVPIGIVGIVVFIISFVLLVTT